MYTRVLSFLFFLSFITVCSYGQQTGKIAGTITDRKTGETLIGLTVKINNTNNGVSTDVNGHYIIGALSPGKYNITFSYVGYQSKNITDIDVAAGATTNLDVVMEEAASNSLAEVVVTASAKKESLNALYAQQKNSARVSDGISAESIRKSPDKNTSEVLKRVSGTTIQDNKFVVVRGLADRYNSASLDNGVLPSTEPNRKAFSFDIVPSTLIDNIIINKTATPDLAGDFAGGSVQIFTKDIPDRNFVSFGGGYSYNTQSTFKNFQSGSRNTSDYFGFDNGLRALPDNFPSTTKVENGLSPDKNIASLSALQNDFSKNNGNSFLNQNYQFSVGRVKDFEKTNNRLGAIFSLTYRNSQNANTGIVRKYHVFDYIDDQYKFATNIGVLANFAYTFKNSKITLKNLYNRTLEDQYTYRTGTNLQTSGDNKFYAFDLMQKHLIKTALEGDHKIGDKNSKLKWTLGFGNVINDQPDQRKVNYKRNDSDIENPNAYSAGVQTVGKENTRLYSYLFENVYSAEANYSKPVTFLRNKATLKVGISSNYRKRDFDVRFLGFQLAKDTTGGGSNEYEEIKKRPLETLYGTDLINQSKYILKEVPNDGDLYDANSLISAGYMMMDSKLGKKSRIVYGVRVESFNLNLNTKRTKNLVSQSFTDFLPSVNYTYSLNDKTNLRAAYFRTLARPEFRELAPFAYYDYERASNVQGNHLLQRSLIDNVDLRFEYFPSAGQIISVSTFYKKFTNAIESSILDANTTPDISYFNSKNAFVYGVEFEFRRNLEFLGTQGLYKNTTFYTNLSLIKSEVKNPDIDNLIEKKRPLVGQSPYVINAGLQHSTLNNLLNLNLLYNRIGRRITNAGGQQFPSVYEAPRDMLDFQLGYKILKSKGELKFNASDILNNNNTLYFDKDLNKRYSANSTDETIGRYRTGSNYSLSFNYSF